MKHGGTLELSVVVPAFNEAERIALTLRSIEAWLDRQSYASEVVVVDDGSTDATRDVATALAIPTLRLIANTPNRGKGHAVRTGMLAARGRLRLFMDADNATPIDELPRLLTALGQDDSLTDDSPTHRVGFSATSTTDAADGSTLALHGSGSRTYRAGSTSDRRRADIAIGSRYANGAQLGRKQPLYRRAWSRFANRVIRATLVPEIRDTQCGFKLFTAEAAEAIFARTTTVGWGFDLEVLALAHRLGFTVVECGVAWNDDRRTQIRPLRDVVRISREFFAIRRAARRGDYDHS